MTARTRHRDLPVVGRSEFIDLPLWGVSKLRAKIDTGALNSALHVDKIEELPGNRVRFDVVIDRKVRHRRINVETPIHRRGRVRSSNGHYARRIFVMTQLKIGPVEREIEISLVDREEMVHRMLLGRSALSGAVLIDVSQRGLLTKKAATKRKVLKKKKVKKQAHPLWF